MSEVTYDEIVSKYDIQLKKELTTAWVKDITLTDATGEVTELRLFWSMDDGYWILSIKNDIPEMNRPEFEYILDSITEDMKFDRDNPWNLVDFVGDK